MRTLLQNAMFITNCDSTLTQLQKRYRDIHKTYQMINSVAEKLKKKPIEMTLIMNFKISVTLLQGKLKRWHWIQPTTFIKMLGLIHRANILWRLWIFVNTTAQLHLTSPELRFCVVSNLARGVSEIRYGEDFWQWSRLEISLSPFHWSTIPQKQFIIIIFITTIQTKYWERYCRFGHIY